MRVGITKCETGGRFTQDFVTPYSVSYGIDYIIVKTVFSLPLLLSMVLIFIEFTEIIRGGGSYQEVGGLMF